MDLAAPVTTLSGVGPVVGKKLAKLGISSLFNLLYHLPFRYEDRTQISQISQVQPGETVTIIGQVNSIKNDFTKSRRFIQKALVSDHSGSIDVVWFNQTYLTRNLKVGEPVALYGKVDFFGTKKTLVSPDYELMTNGQKLIHMGRIVPIYPETAGISSKWLRAKIFPILSRLDNLFPFDIQSLKNIHFPESLDQTAPARRRLAHDELLLLQLTSLLHRESWNKTKLSHIFSVPYPQIRRFIANLPFSLTPSQNKTVDEILTDLSTPNPMNRLLEGDVGSGKTVVAAIAAYAAHLNNFQTLLLAPTQILYQQHFTTLSSLFTPFGINVDLVTASRNTIKPSSHIIVGTHALLNKQYKSAGLIIIDEQHRFGVAQRALAASKGESPHILTMTATPIPRTIALTLYGDLDLSVLSDLPSGRIPVKTWLVPESKRTSAYEWTKLQISNLKSQIFIVCPFIEESETLKSVKAATAELDKLRPIFSSFKLGLLHGKLKAKEKEDIISRFRAGELDILVSTPVVEVGIDIPNATIMIIEAAERFGLAQLHQLRGRVGRSSRQSYCFLFSNSDNQAARLKALETHHSGLNLAEIDLKLRGPGQVYGTAQHGLPQFKAATYEDLDLIHMAKAEAEKILPILNNYPLLRSLLQPDKIKLVQPN